MTYQITLKGVDGMVMASDRLEVEDSRGAYAYPTKSHFSKISTSRDGRFAWAFYGDHLASCVADRFGGELSLPGDYGANWLREASLRAEENGMAGWAVNGGSGTQLPHGLVLADGHAKAIYKSVLDRRGVNVRNDNYLFTGQDRNAAALLVERFYDPLMTVDELAVLAAYSIRVAHDVSPNCVDGLDIAVFRNDGGFRLLSEPETATFWESSVALESELRDCLKRYATR